MGASSGGGMGGFIGNTVNQSTQPFTSQQSYTPPAPRYGNYGQFTGSDVTGMVRQNMGNYGNMANQLQQGGVSPAALSRVSGQNMGNLYTYMNRPNYKQYGDNGQFYQPIYQGTYTDYRSPYVGSGGYGGILGNLGGYEIGRAHV